MDAMQQLLQLAQSNPSLLHEIAAHNPGVAKALLQIMAPQGSNSQQMASPQQGLSPSMQPSPQGPSIDPSQGQIQASIQPQGDTISSPQVLSPQMAQMAPNDPMNPQNPVQNLDPQGIDQIMKSAGSSASQPHDLNNTIQSILQSKHGQRALKKLVKDVPVLAALIKKSA